MGREIWDYQLEIADLTAKHSQKDQEVQRLQQKVVASRKKAETVPTERPTSGGAPKKHPKKKCNRVEVVEQWVEIRKSEDGTTVTELFPSNEDLLKEVERSERMPDLVYRRLHFVGRVPLEYAWTTSDPRTAEAGGMGVQRMTWARWQEQIMMEMLLPGSHVQPCGGNLPRPLERGGCECLVCTDNRWMLCAAGIE